MKRQEIPRTAQCPAPRATEPNLEAQRPADRPAGNSVGLRRRNGSAIDDPSNEASRRSVKRLRPSAGSKTAAPWAI